MDTHSAIALHIGVTTHGRGACTIDTNHTHQQQQIGNHGDIIFALDVLGNAHAPRTDSGRTVCHELGKVDDVCLRNTRAKLDICPRLGDQPLF